MVWAGVTRMGSLMAAAVEADGGADALVTTVLVALAVVGVAGLAWLVVRSRTKPGLPAPALGIAAGLIRDARQQGQPRSGQWTRVAYGEEAGLRVTDRGEGAGLRAEIRSAFESEYVDDDWAPGSGLVVEDGRSDWELVLSDGPAAMGLAVWLHADGRLRLGSHDAPIRPD